MEFIDAPELVTSNIARNAQIKNWAVIALSAGIRVFPTRPNMVKHNMGIPAQYTENTRCWSMGLISAKSLVMASCCLRVDSKFVVCLLIYDMFQFIVNAIILLPDNVTDYKVQDAY